MSSKTRKKASAAKASGDGQTPAPAAASRPRFAIWPWVLGVLLVVSGWLALGYANATPVGGAPDEGAHVQYVKYLCTHGRLPALNVARGNTQGDTEYESHQPPLYYVLAVPFYKAGEATGGAQAAANAANACRVLSILIGMLGVALVWLLAKELAPGRPALWLAAAGFVAFLPMRLSIMGSVSNDGVAEVTCSLALLLMLRAVRGPWTNRQAIWLGAALGLALLAKQNAILLLPPALVAIFLASREVPEGKTVPEVTPAAVRRFLVTGAVVAGVILVVAGWWMGRNTVLYGDPLAMKAFDRYFAAPLQMKWQNFKSAGWTFEMYLGAKVIPTTFDSFWGAFGYLDPKRPDLFMGAYGTGPPSPLWGYPPKSWLYPWLWIACYASVFGALLYGVRRVLDGSRRSEDAPSRGDELAPLGILAIHGLFVLAGFLRFNSTYFQAQGRYLFPALGFLALALTGGWLEWARFPASIVALRKKPADDDAFALPWELPLAVVVVGGMLTLAVYALNEVLIPGFHK